MIPFLCFFEKLFHICQVVISYPATDVFRQTFLQPKEAFAVTALGNGLYFTEKLFLTLLMHSETASAFFQSVECVAEKLLACQCAHHSLFFVDLQEQFLFNKVGNTVSHSLGGTEALDEYYTVVGIADKWMSSVFKFLVELIQYDVAQHGTQWSALWDSLGTFFVFVSYHYAGIQVLVDE